jgi:hypothetical protein
MTDASLPKTLSDAISAAAALEDSRRVLSLEMKIAALFTATNVGIMVAGYMDVLTIDVGVTLLVAAVTALAFVFFFRAWRQLRLLELIDSPPAYAPPNLRDWLCLAGAITVLLAALIAFGLLLVFFGHLVPQLLQGAR